MYKPAEKDTYFVAVKIFLHDSKSRLLITKDRFGDWDLPGGRLRKNDFSTPFIAVARRKLREELGVKVRCTIVPEPVVFMRHERSEVLADGTREKRRIFALGFSARLTRGRVVLGGHHVRQLWVVPNKFKPEKYFYGGWLKGVKEYIKKTG